MTRWWPFPLAGFATITFHPLITAGVPQSIVYVALSLCCVVAIVVGLTVNAPSRRAPWILMAAGQLAWFAGNCVFAYRMDVLDLPPAPSAADAFFLLAYCLTAAGIASLVPATRRGRDAADALDGATVAVGLGVLLWVMVAGPVLRQESAPIIDQVVTVAYPFGDIIVLAALVHLVLASTSRSPALLLLAVAVVLQVVGDLILANGWTTFGQPFDVELFWMASFVLWGSAALHPSMRALTNMSAPNPLERAARRPLILGSAALVLPLILAIQVARDLYVDVWALVVGAVAIVVLVVTRLVVDVSEIRRTTEHRDQLQDDLFQAAASDSLTGLANRSYMLQLAQGALDRGQASGASTGVLSISLDHFKAVNEGHGHRTGDVVLCEVALRLSQAIGPAGHVGRMGGDEFVLLVEAPASQAAVVDLAHLVRSMIRLPFTVDGAELSVDASIGVTIASGAHTDVERLLHEAEVAGERAKTFGRGRVEIFDEALRLELETRTTLERALIAALEHGELTVHYQPVVALGSGAVDAYEALVRWDQPGIGQVQPDQFVPVAELSDLIIRIDTWVLHEATRQLVRWTTDDPERFGTLTVAVNISGRHLADPVVVDHVESALAASGLAAHRLVLEVTETVLVDVPTASTHLQAIRDMGVSISIDDFGTGYTSISQLQNLPADTLKIDRSFIGSDEPGSRELIALMVGAAHACGLLVIAEGVERAEDVAWLTDITCDAAQGFYYDEPETAPLVSCPLPVADVPA